MSYGGNIEPNLPWTRYPLIAFALLTALLAIETFAFDSEGDAFSLLMYVAMSALINWPFVILAWASKESALEEWPKVKSIRLAMWVALTLMSLPYIPLLLELPAVLTSGARNAATVVGREMFFFVGLGTPILGFIGWRFCRAVIEDD